MKIACYFVLAIAFLLVYQRDPVLALMIMGMGIGFFLIKNSRKSDGKEGSFLSLFSGKNSRKEEQGEDIMRLLLHQKLLEFLTLRQAVEESGTANEQEDKGKEMIEKTKQDILDLLEE